MIELQNPESWNCTRLKNVALVNENSLAASTHSDSILNYLEISNVNNRGIISEDAIRELFFLDAPSRARRIVRNGDTVISSVRPNLQALAYIKHTSGNLIASTGFYVVTPMQKRLDGKYTYYLLISDASRQHLEAVAKGVGYPAVDDKDFVTLKFAIPSLLEQQRIASYLDKTCAAIDKTLEAKQKQLEILDALRKSIIHKAVSRGLDKSVELKDSGVEWIPQKPKNWKTCRIKDALNFFNTQRVPISADIRGAMIERKYDYYGASGIIDKVDDYLFDGTYILIAEDGANLLMRNSPLAFLATGRFWVNNHAHILKPRFGNDQYFEYLLESLDYSLYVTGAAQPKLTKENLGKYKIIIPPRVEQYTISKFLDNKTKELDGLTEIIVTQISTLKQYRKSLIHECVTGKRRITETDVQGQL